MSNPPLNNKRGQGEIQTIVFGGGCFWCTEAVFKMLRGVKSVTPGYSGGEGKASYEKVSSGQTGHAEVVRIEYDPEVVKFRDLLTVFFASHDPTSVNRQGADVGTEYRSVIFTTTDSQKEETLAFIKELNDSNEKGAPIVTDVEPLKEFFEAEDYHKDYYAKNKEAMYCQIVINPKLEKVQKEFADLLNK